MNTQKSDVVAEKWKKKEDPFRRISFIAHRTFLSPPDIIFPLLCPTTEFDWLPDWNCELLHTRSGYAEFNCIFKTSFFGMDELFVCTRYEKNLAVDYLRMSTHICGKLEVKLHDHCDGTTTGVWQVTLSAIDETGNDMLQSISGAKEHFEKAIDALQHYLTNGEITH